VGKPEEKRIFGRYRRRWDDNIKRNIKNRIGTRAGLIWFRVGTRGELLSMR
jgi:hypothetical protein